LDEEITIGSYTYGAIDIGGGDVRKIFTLHIFLLKVSWSRYCKISVLL